MIIGIHWREYTLSESVRIIQKMSFKVVSKYYFPIIAAKEKENIIKTYIKELINIILSVRTAYIIVANKSTEPRHEFHFSYAIT